jgi:Tol biopolymer transport system component/tRNA A-37 threonylcarbamoyl transferase component Bud32
MSIAAGTKLGPYEVVAPIGAGGMGEVFKARDTRLDRSVAIKVLPSAFAANAQLRIRFEREAKTISQFSHPNICTLYDIGEHGGVAFLVMEYLQGETLAARLARGPLPIEQVIRYGVQICDALERAHRNGIVHRDLKPGNIMLTASGAKLLDFGLAREFDADSTPDMATEVRRASKSITEEGTIVGTFQYMAPEQLEGNTADARTDIFALGAVLYEMATARRAFQGRTRASLIASILATQPEPVTAVQPAFPTSLDRVIRTCLAKDPEERFQSAHDVKLALQWLTDATVAAQSAKPRHSRAAWITASVMALAFIAAAAQLARDWMAHRNAKPVRTTITAPKGAEFLFLSAGGPPELAPDGTKIVFAAGPIEQRTLWVRPLDGATPQELRGTTGASFPFWSPDGKAIAFFQNGELKKMHLPAGTIATICKAIDGRGGSWSPDGKTIVFAQRFSPIYRVAAAGGTPVAITKLEGTGDVTHRWPRFLPDGRHFLFLASPVGIEDPRNQICAGSVDGTLRKPLVAASSHPLFYDGRLLFTREGNLVAQRLDLDSLALTGDPAIVPEAQIRTDATFARSVVSVANNGTLVYQTGAYIEESDLAWYDRTGKRVGTLGDRQPYGHVALDPRGTVAVVAMRGLQPNLWMIDLERGVKTRLTFGQRDQAPVWSPDGRQLAYGSIKQTPQTELELTVMDFATRSERQLRAATPGDRSPSSWSPDGRMLFYTTASRARTTGNDIYYITIADGKSHAYLATAHDEAMPRMSPDGRYIAYQSRESGRWQIYLAPFPATGEKWQVSPDGGVVPRWGPDGKELFYVVEETMTAIPVNLTGTPVFGTPEPLFRFRSGMPTPVGWDVTPDGQRFLINGFATDEPRQQQPLTLVQNFGTVLRAAERQEE